MQDKNQNENINPEPVEPEKKPIEPESGHIPDVWENWENQARAEREGKAVPPPKDESLDKKPVSKKAWEPIDLSEGTFKHPELYKMPKQNFEFNVRKDLKSILPKFSERDEVAKRLSSVRGKGITKKEIKRELKNLKKEGKLSGFQQKRLRRKFGAF